MRLRPLSVGFVVLLLITVVAPLRAQLEPPSTGGVVALDRELRMLGGTKRVLMIGAHPDDEDTELLTVLVRGLGAEAAYLSLNRGEGGQNLIGPELGPALGLLRTEELLAARRLDGARQYFTRAYDFGYSKSLDETWHHWPRDTVLKDVVRIVRRFRPQVIVSVFSGTPRDGHGQHQAAGWAAREAFIAAGDARRFPELAREEGLAPWTPQKLYRSTWFDTAATTLTLQGGGLDRAAGLSYHQIAMAGRSLHRSQDMGRIQGLGPSKVRLALLEDRTGRGTDGLFGGVDTTAPAAGPSPPSGADLAGLVALRSRWKLATVPADRLAHLDRAIVAAAGVVCDARSDDDRVVPGQRLLVTLECWNTGAVPHRVTAELRGGRGIRPDSGAVTLELEPGALVQRPVTATVAADAPLTTPYFHLGAAEPALYDWSGAAPAERGEPFGAPELTGAFQIDGGARTEREVTLRLNDQARGEVRNPLTIVPRVGLAIDPATEIWPAGNMEPRRFTITLTHGARDTTAGSVRLEAPAGWPAVPPRPFELTREDQRETITFEIHPPASAAEGVVRLRAVARDGAGREYAAGVVAVDYPHIRPRSYAVPAEATIRVARLALPSIARVGYVRGAADRVPEALADVGVPVTLLDAGALERGDLDRFDAIVVGPRAYETLPALGEYNERLLGYVRGGGLLIVQYQQQLFFDGGYAPYLLTVGGPPLMPGGSPVVHDRVTDETAPVRVLAPADPVFLLPNRLSDEDWQGWVQERGLYFARSWHPSYRPLLETHDPGEAPLEGGLLVARVERGTYVYTGLSFFRQLPAGVPGAFRLFANLLALAH
ncbi:MAG TPA: PIG-L family deacetylase [Gemmatimonadales bacterium]|nr:PIG-L family deacetylase [Gemmatimonadales bacterium]